MLFNALKATAGGADDISELKTDAVRCAGRVLALAQGEIARDLQVGMPPRALAFIDTVCVLKNHLGPGFLSHGGAAKGDDDNR